MGRALSLSKTETLCTVLYSNHKHKNTNNVSGFSLAFGCNLSLESMNASINPNIDFDPSIHSETAAAKSDFCSDKCRTNDIGALRGPPPPMSRQAESEKYQPDLEASERKWGESERTWEASEMTCDDWSSERRAPVCGNEERAASSQGRHDQDVCVQDVFRLKIRLAELESRELLEGWHERENIELKEQLRRIKEESVVKQLEAVRVQNFLQDRISELQKDVDRMKRENELLQAVDRGWSKTKQRCPSKKSSNSPATITFRRKSVAGDVGDSTRKKAEDLPLRHSPKKNAFKRRSTADETSTPPFKGNSNTKTSKMEHLPQKITFTRRSTVGDMESPYLKNTQEAARNERECALQRNLPSNDSLPSIISYRRRSTVGEMETPRIKSKCEATMFEVNCLPQEISLGRSIVSEMESPYLQESQECHADEMESPRPKGNQAVTQNELYSLTLPKQHSLSNDTFKKGIIREDAQKEPFSNDTSKGINVAGKADRPFLEENHRNAKNKIESLSPGALLSNIIFKRRSTVDEMERPTLRDDVECLPFPKQTRRRTLEARPLLISLCRGFGAPLSKPSTRMDPFASSSDDSSLVHESWATANAINSQTEMFNRMSSARLRAKLEVDGLSKSEHLKLADTMASPRPNLRRRKSFTLMPSLRDNTRDNDEFDVNNMLWDNDN